MHSSSDFLLWVGRRQSIAYFSWVACSFGTSEAEHVGAFSSDCLLWVGHRQSIANFVQHGSGS